MTICIATICEAGTGNPRIVFASDRLVTDEEGYTFEIGVPKAGRLSSNCYIMEAGNAFRAQRVRDSFKNRMTDEKLDSMTFTQIVEEFSKEFKKIYADTLESEIFQSRGLTRDQFYDNFAKYPDWYSLMVDQQVRNFDFGVNIILMGFDINQEQQFGKAYIYKLTDTGEPENYSQLGFVMIGIGEKLSLPEYTQDKYSPNNTLEDAMVRTYWAKRTAERMTGVGHTTDFGIIWLQKIDDQSEIKCYDVTLVEEVVKEYLDEPFEKTRSEIAKMRDGIKNQLQELLKGKQSK